jgi:hypothetical protein
LKVFFEYGSQPPVITFCPGLINRLLNYDKEFIQPVSPVVEPSTILRARLTPAHVPVCLAMGGIRSLPCGISHCQFEGQKRKLKYINTLFKKSTVRFSGSHRALVVLPKPDSARR